MQALEEKFKENGGWYKSFRIGDLFDIHPTKNYWLTNQKLFETKWNTPVVVNSSLSNGIWWYVNLKPTEKGNIITFSDTTTADSIFYQPNDFIWYSHVQWIYPFEPEKWTKNALRYFCATFRTSTKWKFDYWNKFNRQKAREIFVSLPITKSWEIDFDYMEEYIRFLEAERIEELEAERIEELEAYLLSTGLSHYELDSRDKTALQKFENLQELGKNFNSERERERERE